MFDSEATGAAQELLYLTERLFVELKDENFETLQDIASGFGQKHPKIVITLADQLDVEWFVENVDPAIGTIGIVQCFAHQNKTPRIFYLPGLFFCLTQYLYISCFIFFRLYKVSVFKLNPLSFFWNVELLLQMINLGRQ